MPLPMLHLWGLSPPGFLPKAESATQNPPEGHVWLYQNVNYAGTVWDFDTDVTDFRSHLPNSNDAVSSVKVGPNTTATLYEHIGYGGKSLEANANILNLDSTGKFNDVASSIKVKKN